MIKTLHSFLFLLCISFIPLSVSADSHDAAIDAAVNNPARSEKDRERDLTSKPAEVLKFFGVKPGMKVLDLLSGAGYYSEILAYAVGDSGKVVAHTNQAYRKFVGDALDKRFANNRLPNVEQLVSEVPALGLAEEEYDMILMVMTYHDIYYEADYWPAVDRDNMFKQIRDALKPGGILAIIDHSAKAGSGSSAAQDLHRIDEKFAIRDIESAGFELDGTSDILRREDDDRTIQVFDEKIRRKTDRFVHLYTKN